MFFSVRQRALVERIEKEVEKLMADLTSLKADVAAQSTVIQSAVTLLNGLSAQLAAAIASNDPTQLAALQASIEANTSQLSAAVAANTQGPAAGATGTTGPTGTTGTTGPSA